MSLRQTFAVALLAAALIASPAAGTEIPAASVPMAAAGPEARGTTGGPFDPGLIDMLTIPEIAYTEALRKARAGEIERVVVRDRTRMRIYLRDRDGREYKALVPGRQLDPVFLEKTDLRADEGDLVTLAVEGAFGLVYALILLAVLLYVGAMARKFSRNPARRVRGAPGRERVTFAGVAGQLEAKEELREVVEFLRDPSRFAALGARVPRGVLMEGEPGNGKTLLAKAVAGEAGVPFFHIAGSEVLEMFAGLGARRIRQVFRECRRNAPCILFIDEIETVGGRRGNGSGGDAQNEREQILNQLLVEMDGLEGRGDVVVIGATNRPDMLDPALTRPGRLDRRVAVGKPDREGRESILAVHARKVPLADGVDLAEVARMTPGFSGAEIANLVNEAAIVAARRALGAVDMDCFHAARDKALMGEERRSASLSEEERRVAAYHEAGHAIVALRLEHSDPVHKITVVPRGRSLGAVVRLPERDRVLVGRAKLEADLAVAMGGRAAEELVFGAGHVTTGAVADIEQATLLAREMAGRWGMFEELGRMNYLGRAADGHGAASQASLARLDEAVRDRIEAAYAQALAILSAERGGLDALVARLMEEETIDGDEARAVIDGVASSGQDAGGRGRLAIAAVAGR